VERFFKQRGNLDPQPVNSEALDPRDGDKIE